MTSSRKSLFSKGGRPRKHSIEKPKIQMLDGRNSFIGILRATLPSVATIPGVVTQSDVQPYLDQLSDGLEDSATSLALTRALERVVPADQSRKRSDRASYTDAELTDAMRELMINNKAKMNKMEEKFGVPSKTLEHKMSLIRKEINRDPLLANKPLKTLAQMRKFWATKEGRRIVKGAFSAVGTFKKKSGPKQFLSDIEKVVIAHQTHAKSMSGEISSRLDMAPFCEEVIKVKGKRMASEAVATGNEMLLKRAKRMEEAKPNKSFVRRRLVDDVAILDPDVNSSFRRASAISDKRAKAGDEEMTTQFNKMVADKLHELLNKGVIPSLPSECDPSGFGRSTFVGEACFFRCRLRLQHVLVRFCNKNVFCATNTSFCEICPRF